jgi:hypothetical protein
MNARSRPRLGSQTRSARRAVTDIDLVLHWFDEVRRLVSGSAK